MRLEHPPASKGIGKLAAVTVFGAAAYLGGCSTAASMDRGKPQEPRDASVEDVSPPADAAVTQAAIEAAAAEGLEDGACPLPCEGTCTQGRCLVALADAAGPTDIVIDDASVYFSSCADGGGAVLGVPLGGGSAVTLASGSGCPTSIALGAASLYIAGLSATEILQVPLTGGPTAVVVADTDPPAGVAVDSANVYFTTAGGALKRTALDGGAATLIASCSSGCTRPLAHGAVVYWGDPGAGTIRSAPGADGGLTTLATGVETVASLGIAGQDLYFADGYLLAVVPLAGGNPMSVGLPTGEPVGAVAVDPGSAYYTSWGSIWKIGFSESQPVRIGTDQGAPNAIAVDDTSVYWANAVAWPSGGCCGRVMKLTPK